jgi:hypothetical protein
MIPIVHRIEILSSNPAMSKMIPRMIMAVSLSDFAPTVRLEIGPVERLLDADLSQTPLGRVVLHP